MTAGPTRGTLLLDTDNWDLCLDANGNIAVAQPPYAVAQDVSSAIRTFLGECWYDTTLGVPYRNILGKNPPLTYLIAQIEAAALSVAGVVSAVCTIQNAKSRSVVGQCVITDSDGGVQTISLGTSYPAPALSGGQQFLTTGSGSLITTESGEGITT